MDDIDGQEHRGCRDIFDGGGVRGQLNAISVCGNGGGDGRGG